MDPTVQISLPINGPNQILTFNLARLWESLHFYFPNSRNLEALDQQLLLIPI
jgi:hypothetical protein